MSAVRSNRLIVTLLVMIAIGHNFHGIWRRPRSRNRDFASLDLWIDLAKKAEAAKVDAFFFTDLMGIQGEFNGSRDVIFEQAMNVPIADCSMLLSAIARETSDIGPDVHQLGDPASPICVRAHGSTLDQLSGGRVG